MKVLSSHKLKQSDPEILFLSICGNATLLPIPNTYPCLFIMTNHRHHGSKRRCLSLHERDLRLVCAHEHARWAGPYHDKTSLLADGAMKKKERWQMP
jgi:hypothetical protein